MTHGERIDRGGALLDQLRHRAQRGLPVLGNTELAASVRWHGPLASSYAASYLQRLEAAGKIEIERIGASGNMRRRVLVVALQAWTPWPPGTPDQAPARTAPKKSKPPRGVAVAPHRGGRHVAAPAQLGTPPRFAGSQHDAGPDAGTIAAHGSGDAAQVPGGAKRAAHRAARAQGVEAVFEALVQLALSGGRCPENNQVEKRSGFQFGSKIKDLASAGRIRIEVYDKNFRVVEICEGQHKGRRTMAAPPGRKPYMIVADGERRHVRQPPPRPVAALRLAPTPPPELDPLADIAAEPLTGGIEFLALKETTCRWPLGAPKEPARLFCGGATPKPGVPYCRHHMAKAYDRPKTRRVGELAARNHHRSAAAI